MMDSAASSSAQRPAIWRDSTGKERDAVTGLDFFLARYYSGAQGRFLSPDEFKGGPEDALTGKDIIPLGPLPYADISNPQTLNKYDYVLNNPLRYIDPDGHGEQDQSSDPNKPKMIYSVSYTTAVPGMIVGGILGEAIEPVGGGVPGALLGSMFGVGVTASYVPSTNSSFAGATASFTPMLMGGQGISGSSAIVPPAQNPNSIADGGSVSLNLQPTPMTGSTVTKSPGNGPAVAGPSVGTRVPVTISASYSKDILPVVNTVVREAKSAIEFIKKKLVTDK